MHYIKRAKKNEIGEEGNEKESVISKEKYLFKKKKQEKPCQDLLIKEILISQLFRNKGYTVKEFFFFFFLETCNLFNIVFIGYNKMKYSLILRLERPFPLLLNIFFFFKERKKRGADLKFVCGFYKTYLYKNARPKF